METTLGGNTIPALLREAANTHDVGMLFCGLASVEMHIERVALRVAHGGHAIPEEKIRERWIASKTNLVGLLPHLAWLQVFDNSVTVMVGEMLPAPRLVLEMVGGRVVGDAEGLAAVPDWARPIVEAAMGMDGGRGDRLVGSDTSDSPGQRPLYNQG